jgi:protein-L-isoaspartate O-methyltransferase
MIKKLLDKLYFKFEVLCYYIPFFSKLYIGFHRLSVIKEIKMLNLLSSDKVLHIGCGAIPYTMIIISNEIGSEIVGIDQKKQIINFADYFLKKYNISKNVKIENGNGKTYNVADFDVIIISYGIDDQDLVLKHVFESMKDSTKTILRKSISEKNEYINVIIRNHSFDSIRSLLTQNSVLIKKNNA